MIFVHDRGRMANNILQYAHVYAWAREHGLHTVSMRFAYKYPWFHICHTRHHHFLTYVLAKYAAKWGIIPTVRFDEPGADYHREEELMLRSRLIVVGGWYARWYDFFLKYRQDIVRLFAFDDKVERRVAQTMVAQGGVSLGVHIRRGDYATFKGGCFLYNDAQYVSLILQFCQLHPEASPTVYICGNDPHLDKDYYLQQLRGVRVVFPEGNPAEDLCLLSRCDYLIGPPSTFTLVAAMYRDLPLYWIEDPSLPLSPSSFRRFDYLFRHIQ